MGVAIFIRLYPGVPFVNIFYPGITKLPAMVIDSLEPASKILSYLSNIINNHHKLLRYLLKPDGLMSNMVK